MSGIGATPMWKRRIRGAKDTGARNLPWDTFERNAVWLALVMMAQDLLVHTQTLTMDGRLRTAEPKTLRYQILHTRPPYPLRAAVVPAGGCPAWCGIWVRSSVLVAS